ncbi:MAG: hypothetical protein IKL10_08580 [Clostridia bacterium]|nr:hypothetical protein [Clostridia bacterium]
MKEGAFVKVPRDIFISPYFDDPVMLKLWLTLLLLARFYPEEAEGITVERGQLLTTQKYLTEKTKIPRGKLRSLLEKLKEDKAISIVTKDKKYTLITVNYYMNYISTNELLNSFKNVEKCVETS